MLNVLSKFQTRSVIQIMMRILVVTILMAIARKKDLLAQSKDAKTNVNPWVFQTVNLMFTILLEVKVNA